MSQQRAEARAEAMGYEDRETGEPRDSNPYARLAAHDELERAVIGALADAWWRGWDQAEAVIRRRNLP